MSNNAPALRDFRTKISSSMQLIEKLSVEIKNYEQLPVVHVDLQSKVRALARVLFYLQANADCIRDRKAIEQELLVLDEDIQALNQR